MFWFLTILAKTALAYTGVKTAKTVIKYATTDQEKEGREIGTEVAANIYKPVLDSLKRQKDKIIAEEQNEQSNFESQANLLTEQCAYYERETANYKSLIATIIREHGTSPGVKAVLAALSAGGGTIGAGVPCSV